MRKTSILIIGILLLSACAKPITDPIDKPMADPITGPIDIPAGKPKELPLTINLEVPFFPQAPDGNWNQPWQDSCEEAAVLLSYYYAAGRTPAKDEFKKDILTLIDWENKNFGSYRDTDIEQTNLMLKENFGIMNHESRIMIQPSVENLKQELSQGHVIVAPFAGRQLHNPYYSNTGPYYHMMVIKGYDEKNFITNDVGTRRGQNYKYPYETIMSAMHEWNDTDINLGAKKVIVVIP
jgi:hypothetical protein